MNSNQELMQRRSQAIPRGVGQIHPIFADRAENCRVWDVEGREYLDFAGGIAVLNTGHLHPKVVAAVEAQLKKLSHTCFQVLAYEPYLELCEIMNQKVPGDFAKKTLLVTTGSEAVENAVKIARAATKSAREESSPPETPITAHAACVCVSRLASACDCNDKINSFRSSAFSPHGTNGIDSIFRNDKSASPTKEANTRRYPSSFGRNVVSFRRSCVKNPTSISEAAPLPENNSLSFKMPPFSAMRQCPANTQSVVDSPFPASAYT